MQNNPSSNKFTLSLDLRLVTILLLAVIAAMLLLWRPWQDTVNANARTVEVTGQATVKAAPDEYVFYPSYTFSNPSRQASVDAAAAKSDELLGKLKGLGVAPSKIKSNTSGFDGRYNIQPAPDDATDTTYTLTLTVTVSGKDTAQKVQDYLATTSPTGPVSPQASFSDSMRKSLENKARDQATRDARAKADQSAFNLGFKVTKVKSVNDGAGFGGVTPFRGAEQAITMDAASAPKLSVQPGENELPYSVTVVYYIK